MIFLSSFLRASHKFLLFFVSYRAFGRESGRTSRLLPGQFVLRSRSESTALAHTPESDTDDYHTSSFSTSRSLSPSMSNNDGTPNPNQPQAQQSTGMQSNVPNTFFHHPLVYPTVPVQSSYNGPAQNPPQQQMYNPAQMQAQPEMYTPAQFFNLMANMQHYLRNTFPLYEYYLQEQNRNLLYKQNQTYHIHYIRRAIYYLVR